MDHELSIGQVQWHSSEEDGFPDVGILLRLSETEELWFGELLDAEGGGHGFVLYGPGDKRRVFQRDDYDDVRELIEDYIAPAIARHRQSAIAELCEGLRWIEERVFPHPNSSHVYVDSIRAECRTLLSKHSPDAPGQHAGTRAIEPSDGDEA